ncbi:hypothetical protein JM18_009336 [Phytophthora kernoviae]|uniref:C2 domain-containing protein n=2 Tax=Phytophthora kernoviae TaxID=325452 RepID=A0A921S8J4_9STRA|nr:hypothetical protein G195_011111 [Phytophthora kernoviae 00238/432]KAG2506929.1 hypothetical protein JM18_009336 [Phytophthora kernoviae]
MGLDVTATLEPTGITGMMATFIQLIWGPTAFIGEIDDGSLEDALALTTDGDAFHSSLGTWSHSNNGTANVTGRKTVFWNSTVEKLHDKTLCMNRWRPGYLGLIVTLLRASNLPIADTFIQGSSSDPFVTLQLGDEYFRSSCVNGSLDPVWQPAEVFEFEVPHLNAQMQRQLEIQVVDNDRFKQDDLLGELQLSLSLFEARPNEAAVDTYELKVPEDLKQAAKHPEKKTTLQLDICLIMETDGQKTLCVWENEDYVDGDWKPSHSNERRHWSTFDLQVSSDNFDHVAPEVPEGLEGAGWAYSTKKGDDHGWIYACTYTGPWSASSFTTCYARRRLWQNNCRPAIACE